MEQLNQQNKLELNESLREIQDSFDNAVGELGSEEKAIKSIQHKYKSDIDIMKYRIYTSEFFDIFMTELWVTENNLCIDLCFNPKFIKTTIECLDRYNFTRTYFEDLSYREVDSEYNIRLNQLDIESHIIGREKLAENYINFIKNKYNIQYVSNRGEITKDLSLKVGTLFYDKSMIISIFKHLSADFFSEDQEGNIFAMKNENENNIKILRLVKGKLRVIFRNATFEETEESCKKIQERIVEIKEIILLRSNVGKIIEKTKGSLFRNLLDIYPLPTPKRKELKEEDYEEIKRIFEEMRKKGEKRESEIMLYFLEDTYEAVLLENITKEEYYNILRRIGNEDISVVAEYYEKILSYILINDGSKEKIEAIIDIYKKIYLNFHSYRNSLGQIMVKISASYITKKGLDYIDMDILDTLSKISEGYLPFPDFYSSLYDTILEEDKEKISEKTIFIALGKYRLFDDYVENIRLSSREEFIRSILIPIFTRKLGEDIMHFKKISSEDISMENMIRKLGLSEFIFFEKLFLEISDDTIDIWIKKIHTSLINTIMMDKNESYTLRKSMIELYVGLWQSLNIDIKEVFVEEFLNPTISEQAADDMNKYDMTYFEREDIIEEYEIYRNYMDDKYVDFFIDEVMKVRKF